MTEEKKSGELSMRVDVDGDKVKLAYSKPISWIDMSPYQARILAYLLISRSKAIDGVSWDQEALEALKPVRGGESDHLELDVRERKPHRL